MKFDLIIGNPPYDRSLHLKILKEAMKHIDFEKGGEIIWLHPARWLAAIGDKSKYSWMNGKIANFENMNIDSFFGIGLFSDGLISHFSNNGANIDDFNPIDFRGSFKGGDSKIHPKIKNTKLALEVFNKILQSSEFSPIADFEKEYDLTATNGKFYVQHNLLVGNGGFQPKHIYYNGKSLMNGKTIFENRGAMNKTSKLLINSIEFKTKDEAENYRMTQFGKFILFIDAITRVDIHVHSNMIPFMRDYTQPWSDNRFYETFNLSTEEIELIEETIGSTS